MLKRNMNFTLLLATTMTVKMAWQTARMIATSYFLFKLFQHNVSLTCVSFHICFDCFVALLEVFPLEKEGWNSLFSITTNLLNEVFCTARRPIMNNIPNVLEIYSHTKCIGGKNNSAYPTWLIQRTCYTVLCFVNVLWWNIPITIFLESCSLFI